jgi:hypothetical protein
VGLRKNLPMRGDAKYDMLEENKKCATKVNGCQPRCHSVPIRFVSRQPTSQLTDRQQQILMSVQWQAHILCGFGCV